MLQGGIEKFGGGISSGGNSGGNTGGTTNSLGGGGTPWGMIAQAIENKRDRISQQLMNLGNNFTNQAMAAASWHPNFNPIMAQGYQPQNMQSNLYGYITQ